MSLPSSRSFLLPATLVVLAVSAAPSTALAAPGVAAVTAMMVFATPISDKYAALGGSGSVELKKVVAEAPGGFGTEPDTYRYDVLFARAPVKAKTVLPQLATREGVDDIAAAHVLLDAQRVVAGDSPGTHAAGNGNGDGHPDIRRLVNAGDDIVVQGNGGVGHGIA